MDIFMQLLRDFGSLIVTLCWVFMLIDCLTNKKMQGGNKVGWGLFIFFTQIIGALIYFGLGKSYLPAKIFHYVRKQPKKPYYRPSQPVWTPPQPQSGYQQGYQAQNWMPSLEQRIEVQDYDPQFEQPQASYPEMQMPPQ